MVLNFHHLVLLLILIYLAVFHASFEIFNKLIWVFHNLVSRFKHGLWAFPQRLDEHFANFGFTWFVHFAEVLPDFYVALSEINAEFRKTETKTFKFRNRYWVLQG